MGALASGNSTQIQLTVKVKDVPVGTSITNTVTVDDSVTKTTGTDDDTDTIAITNAKSFVSSSEGDSTDPQVFIGETLTYQIQLVVPPGLLTGLTAVDVLDAGLAFDECLSASVSAPATVTTTLAGGFADACPADSGDPNVTNSGHNITFDFGDVENTSATDDATITVLYNVIVLDTASNKDGVNDINNAVTWTWDGGSLDGSAAPVEIIEPDLLIEKTVDREVIAIGRTVTYTIDIAHTAASRADAYDVVVTDVVPVGMEYVAGSFIYTGLQPDVPYPTYDPATATLTVSWAQFPLLATSSFTFDAIFVGPSPVVNEASVTWTSLPLDPQSDGTPVQQSSYNGDSTERWYDPTDTAGINDYRVTSGVTVRKPALPDTGFAPGVHTVLPTQPLEQAYNVLDGMWLEISALNIKMPVVGIPVTSKGWDLTWLSNQAGYLVGTTYPSQVGTTGITGHVYLADGTPGPFLNLGNMLYGNQVILHVNGQRYIFEVRTKQVVPPSDTSVFKEDGYTWLTLITCKEYDARNNTYRMRVAVRAVLVRVE
jgi:LPXTG-site transpeptidase (sortase) family protein